MNDDIFYENWIQTLEQAQKKQDESISMLLKPSINVKTFTSTFFSRVGKKEEYNLPTIETTKSTQAYRNAMAEIQWKGKRVQVQKKIISFFPTYKDEHKMNLFN